MTLWQLALLTSALAVSGCQPATAPQSSPEQPAPASTATTPSANVTGQLLYRERIALAADAQIQVQLRDTSRADAAAPLLAEISFSADGRQVPLPFSLSYDPALIIANHSYSLTARISDSGGKLLFINDTNIPVITRDAPTAGVEIRLIKVN